jgi:hypothetical protein
VTLSIAATGASEMYVSNTSGCSEGGAWETFSASKSWTLTSLNSVSRVYVKFRAADGAASTCLSGSVIHDDIAPTAPTTVNDGTTNASLIASPTISWTASDDSGSGVSRYEVSIGTSAGGSDIKAWTAVGNITTTQITGLSLSANTTYYASARAIDAAGNTSSVSEGNGWTATASSISCPTNYVAIPANNDLGTAAFCVMKYEAKDVGGVAKSEAGGGPWDNIQRGANATTANSAWKACKDLNITNPVSGMTFDLITNVQWQAIARNIEAVASNWSNGSISISNSLNRGNSNQSSALAADASDNNGCIGIWSNGDPADSCSSAWHVNKRTHTLSSGAVIWDIAGNVWEWVSDDIDGSTLTPSLSANAWREFTNASFFPSPGDNRQKFAPLGAYDTSHGMGQLYGGSGGAVLRGGDWLYGTYAGVFAADLSNVPSATGDYIGFRCSAVGGL